MDWQELGPAEELPALLTQTDPKSDKRYVELINKLKLWHKELLDENFIENPTLIGDYLGKIRLNVNLLFAYMNVYLDNLVELNQLVAKKRQAIYVEKIKDGATPNSAEMHAKALVRIDEANIKTLEYRIKQIQNEYERYNSICIYLQSRLKEYNTERMLG